jgi:beta-aspartyl-peptidase (threonine type)
MEKSPHVLLSGNGADEFARDNGLEIVDPSYFYTPERWRGLQRIRERDSLQQKDKQTASALTPDEQLARLKEKYGTVGAVALDQHGNLAAATSTGGMSNKKWGRIGDAPIIGAGTYANNATVAISATGWGEYFLRLVMAKSISDRMEYGNQTLAQASHEMVMQQLPKLGGDGGLIAVDKYGNIAMPFCTEGMYRGYIRKDNAASGIKMHIAIFK